MSMLGNLFFNSSGEIFADSLIMRAFLDSNTAGQVIVCILLAFSFAAWLIMLAKWADLSELNKLNTITEFRLEKTESVFDATIQNRGMKGPYAYLINEALKAWKKSKLTDVSDEMFSVNISRVENALQRAVGKQTMLYEKNMVSLGSIISGAPFLGLLGTVWGVMDSFGAMGQEGATATLQALAPGVSGALLTTVAGLVVAIPSVFGYNYLLAHSRVMTLNLENFASQLADRIELEARENVSTTRNITLKNLKNSDMFELDKASHSSLRDLNFDLNNDE